MNNNNLYYNTYLKSIIRYILGFIKLEPYKSYLIVANESSSTELFFIDYISTTHISRANPSDLITKFLIHGGYANYNIYN